MTSTSWSTPSPPPSAPSSWEPATTDGPSWRDLRREAEARLRALEVGDPASEARWMVERVSGYDGGELVGAETEPATVWARDHLDAMLAHRAGGEPLQYVLGVWSFRGLDLLIDRRVLIPRPETETTAEVAIEEAQRLGARRGAADPWKPPDATAYAVADLGTGSGALALALAAELPDAEVWATDTSEDALAVARANLAGAGLPATRVRLAAGDWFDALPPSIDFTVIVTNPPYVAESARLPPDVADYEPRSAIVSGPTGLEAIERLVADAPQRLAADGALVCEIAPHQGDVATELARAAGFSEAFVRRDLTDRDRVLVARTSE